MSRQRQQQEDFRRIVGVENGQGLGDPLPRDEIGERNKVIMLNGEGAVFGQYEVEDADDEDDGFDSRNPNFDADSGTVGGSGDGGIIDNEFVEEITDQPLTPEDIFGGTLGDLIGGLNDNWGGVGGFLAQDCETGDCIQVALDGEFRPPEGFEVTDQRTDNETYVAGKFWEFRPINFAAPGNAGTVSAAVSDGIARWNSITGPSDDITDYSFVVYSIDSNTGYPNGVTVTYTQYGTARVRNAAINLTVCSEAQIENGDYWCDLTNQPSDQWPSDDCTQLAQDENGVWRMHPSEPDRIAKYEQGTQLGFICSGASQYQRLDGVNGGSVIWDYMNNKYAYKDPVEGRWKFGSSSSINSVVSPIVRRDPDSGDTDTVAIMKVGGPD